MTETQVLIGSLSNDLLRVASLAQRGAKKGSERFFSEAKKWAGKLEGKDVPGYINEIAKDIVKSSDKVNTERAERYLMYGILLQNYSLRVSK